MDYQARGDDVLQPWAGVHGGDYVAVQGAEPAQRMKTLDRALHPLSVMFPALTGDEFASLVSDIRAHGLRQPITLVGDAILDGQNRYRACLEAGVEPVYSVFNGDNNALVAFVLSANLSRRHLAVGQKAALAAKAQDWARANQAGGDRKSTKVQPLHLDTVADRAAVSGASPRTQKMADKVVRASSELGDQVVRGEITLLAANTRLDAEAHAKPRRRLTPPRNGKVAELARLRNDNANLRERIAELEDSTQEACGVAADLIAIANGEEAERMTVLRRDLKSTKAALDACMVTGSELKKQCQTLERKLKKAGLS